MGAIVPSAGALANDMEALQAFMRAVIDANPFASDPTAIDVPWRRIDERGRPKLMLGLLPEKPLTHLHPPVRGTLKRALQILKAHGHDAVLLDAADRHVDAANQVGALQNQRAGIAECWRKLWATTRD